MDHAPDAVLEPPRRTAAVHPTIAARRAQTWTESVALTARLELSVLMTTWNAAATVERAIASVLSERDLPLECIVVDDGSTDDTARIVRAIAERDPRVVLASLPLNLGVSVARNHGLTLARGTWLAFVDADDRLRPGAIAALMQPTADPDVLAVVGQRVWTDGTRTWVSAAYDIPDIREAGRKSIVTNPGLMYYASTTGKVFHRSLVDDLRFEGRVLGDQAWTIRALLRAGHHIETVDRTVYEWSRPSPGDGVEAQTLTSSKLWSAVAAAEMVDLATRAFHDVAHEIDRQVDGSDTRRTLKRVYLDRLIRSDMGAPLRAAMERADPATADLFASIGAFLESIPADVLAGSSEVIDRIVLPPAWRWRRLPSAARGRYWTMADAAMRAEPPVPTDLASRGVGTVLALGRRGGHPGRWSAFIALSASSLAWSMARRLRDVRRGDRPGGAVGAGPGDRQAAGV